VPGDTHASEFGWMIPITQAIGTDEVARVDQAIVRDGSYGGQFRLWAAVAMGLRRLPLSGPSLLTNLDRRGQ
jgi:hypothetical protein